MRGLLQSATTEEIAGPRLRAHAGRYVGAAGAEDDGEPFEEKMKRLTATLEEQFCGVSTVREVDSRESSRTRAWTVTSPLRLGRSPQAGDL